MNENHGLQTSTKAALKTKSDSARAVFDLDRLQGEMEFHLPQALRSLADAIESGDMDGKLSGFVASDKASFPGDERLHLHVKLHLATEIRKQIETDRLEPCATQKEGIA